MNRDTGVAVMPILFYLIEDVRRRLNHSEVGSVFQFLQELGVGRMNASRLIYFATSEESVRAKRGKYVGGCVALFGISAIVTGILSGHVALAGLGASATLFGGLRWIAGYSQEKRCAAILEVI